MGLLELVVSMPLPNHHESYTDSYNVSGRRRYPRVSRPTRRVIYITNFQNFQIVNTSNQGCKLSNCNCGEPTIVLGCPNDSSFPQESINRRKTPESYKEHGPPKSCGCRTLVQCFKIPNVLRTCCFHRRLVRSGHRPHEKCPHSEVHQNIDKHVCPKRTHRI